jgi:hypothetical protein
MKIQRLAKAAVAETNVCTARNKIKAAWSTKVSTGRIPSH